VLVDYATDTALHPFEGGGDMCALCGEHRNWHVAERSTPCGSCVACCSGPGWGLRLDPDDDPERYTTVIRDGHDWVVPSPVHGGCLYLVDGRCSIYDERPNVCRRYDCADYDERTLKPHLRVAAGLRKQR
jgi:hypothetical protein